MFIYADHVRNDCFYKSFTDHGVSQQKEISDQTYQKPVLLQKCVRFATVELASIFIVALSDLTLRFLIASL